MSVVGSKIVLHNETRYSFGIEIELPLTLLN